MGLGKSNSYFYSRFSFFFKKKFLRGSFPGETSLKILTGLRVQLPSPSATAHSSLPDSCLLCLQPALLSNSSQISRPNARAPSLESSSRPAHWNETFLCSPSTKHSPITCIKICLYLDSVCINSTAHCSWTRTPRNYVHTKKSLKYHRSVFVYRTQHWVISFNYQFPSTYFFIYFEENKTKPNPEHDT